MVMDMSDRDVVVPRLDSQGVLHAIRWAFLSATDRVDDDYSEAAGHDATWIGVSRFTLLRDRLDRVFSCGRYAVPKDADGRASLDLLHAELSPRDTETFPVLETGVVRRSNLNGSPGWATDEYRFLLASASLRGLDDLPWPRKSPTKQLIASQPNPDSVQASLFDEMTDDERGGLAELLTAEALALDTLVVAHAQDVDRGERRLVIGRPCLNEGGGSAWHWMHNLLDTPPHGGGRLQIPEPEPPAQSPVPDAPVRLRKKVAQNLPAERAEVL